MRPPTARAADDARAAELHPLARAGDPAALDELARIGLDIARRLARSMTRLAPHRTDEALASVTTAVAEAVRQFDPARGRFSGLVAYRAHDAIWEAINRGYAVSFNDAMRRSCPRAWGRWRTYNAAAGLDAIRACRPAPEGADGLRSVAGRGGPDDAALEAECLLARLDPESAELVRAKFGIGRPAVSLQEIAAGLGLRSGSAVHGRIADALGRLRQMAGGAA